MDPTNIIMTELTYRPPVGDGTAPCWEADGRSIQFCVLEPAGAGACCETFLARRCGAEGPPVRLKMCRDTSGEKEARFLRSVQIQIELLGNRSTVNAAAGLLGVYRGEDGHLWTSHSFNSGVCYDKVEEPSVYSALRSLQFLTQIVERVHGRGYMVLDIKPDNVFQLEPGSGVQGMTMIDFDSLVTREELRSGGVRLSTSEKYGAPEVLHGLWEKVGPVSDVYSIGVILFEKLMGRFPGRYERCSFSRYNWDRAARPELLRNLSAAARAELTEFFRHTIVLDPALRYPDTGSLMKALDRLSDLTNPLVASVPRLNKQRLTPTCLFVGQEGPMRRLADHLAGEGDGAQAAVIHGPSGVGKSEMGRSYIQRHAQEYDGCALTVFDPKTMDTVEKLVDKLDILSAQDTRSRMDCLSKLGRHDLIFLDNCDDMPPALLAAFLDRVGKARVLVTTQNAQLAQLPGVLDCALSEYEGQAMKVFQNLYYRGVKLEELPTVDAILRSVGYNSYAADLIARELNENPQLTLEKFREAIQKEGFFDAAPEGTQVVSTKDGQYQSASVADHIQVLFSSVLNTRFTQIERKLLLLLMQAPAQWFDLELACQVVGDTPDQVYAAQAAKRLVGRNRLRLQRTETGAQISIHPLMAGALGQVIADDPAARLNFAINWLTIDREDQQQLALLCEYVFPISDIFIDEDRWQRDCAAFLPYGGLAGRIRRAVAARTRTGKYDYRYYLKVKKIFDTAPPPDFTPDAGLCVHGAAYRGDCSAQYFVYFRDQDAAISYLRIARRSYELDPSLVETELAEARTGEGEHIALYHVVGAEDEGVFNLALSRTEAKTAANLRQKHRWWELCFDDLSRETVDLRRFAGGFPAAPVRRIAGGAFQDASFRIVAFPDTVEELGPELFGESGSKTLEAVHFPRELRTIESKAFSACSALKDAILPEGTQAVGSCAFFGCTGLEDLLFPDTVRSLGVGVADSCSALTRVRLPQGLEEIPNCAFLGSGIREIEIPPSVTRIGICAFAECACLEKVSIPPSVTQIGKYAFLGCKELREVSLPGVLRVDEDAFSCCDALSTVELGSEIRFSDYAFRCCPQLKRVRYQKSHLTSSVGVQFQGRPIMMELSDGRQYSMERIFTPVMYPFDTDRIP